MVGEDLDGFVNVIVVIVTDDFLSGNSKSCRCDRFKKGEASHTLRTMLIDSIDNNKIRQLVRKYANSHIDIT